MPFKCDARYAASKSLSSAFNVRGNKPSSSSPRVSRIDFEQRRYSTIAASIPLTHCPTARGTLEFKIIELFPAAKRKTTHSHDLHAQLMIAADEARIVHLMMTGDDLFVAIVAPCQCSISFSHTRKNRMFSLLFPTARSVPVWQKREKIGYLLMMDEKEAISTSFWFHCDRIFRKRRGENHL